MTAFNLAEMLTWEDLAPESSVVITVHGVRIQVTRGADHTFTARAGGGPRSPVSIHREDVVGTLTPEARAQISALAMRTVGAPSPDEPFTCADCRGTFAVTVVTPAPPARPVPLLAPAPPAPSEERRCPLCAAKRIAVLEGTVDLTAAARAEGDSHVVQWLQYGEAQERGGFASFDDAVTFARTIGRERPGAMACVLSRVSSAAAAPNDGRPIGPDPDDLPQVVSPRAHAFITGQPMPPEPPPGEYHDGKGIFVDREPESFDGQPLAPDPEKP